MAKKKDMPQHKHHGKQLTNHSGGSAVYILGVVGAAAYYIQQADSFWMGVLGILKALVWPAFLVYEALSLLKM